MDEEAQKRNTDCVYFLASPLTCKKGINCEFRHSEVARLHPRDCRYWLGGNCLNANCPFRHPPLDGRPASVSVSAATSTAPSKAALAPSVSGTSSSMPANKPRTPCYFFSQGYCSKGDRCAFLHGSLLSINAHAAGVQKPPKAPACKGVETDDKSVNVVEMNGSTVQKLRRQGSKFGAGLTPVHTLPSNVFIRAQEAHHVNSDEHREKISQGSRTSLSSKHQNVYATSIKIHNPPDIHKTEQSVEQRQQQRLNRDDHICVEAKQQQSFPHEERIQNGSCRDGLLKEASPCAEEFDNSVDGEGDRDLLYFRPYLNASTRSPRRTNGHNETHDFGPYVQDQSRLYGTPFSTEHDSECFDQLYEYDYQPAYPESRGRHQSPLYYARKDRYRIRGDLRDRLSKRRNCAHDLLSDINGHIEGFQDTDDYVDFDEWGWDDSFECAPSRSEGANYWRRLERADCRRVQSPNYDIRSDKEGDNAIRSFSGSSPMRFSVGDYPRSILINSGGGWFGSRKSRRYSELEVLNLGDQRRSAHTRLESRINVDDSFQAQGAGTLKSEIHAGSYSNVVERPPIKSRVLPDLSSNVSELDLRGSTLSKDFEGPKPLSVLLQEKRKGRGDRGKAGSDKEEHGIDREYSSNLVCSEKATIIGRKRKQEDSFGGCLVPRIA